MTTEAVRVDRTAVVEILLNVEIAYDYDSGELGSPSEYFVRGGHYREAFIRAAARMIAEDYGAALDDVAVLRPHVHWLWWREVLADDAEAGTFWQYVACKPDDPGAYRVTKISIRDALVLARYRCGACWDGDHDACQVKSQPAEKVTLHQRGGSRRVRPGELRAARWTYDPRPFY